MTKFIFLLSAGLLNLLFSVNGLAQSESNASGDLPKFLVTYTERGFTLEFEQSSYQFIPSKEKIEKACLGTVYRLSELVAEKHGRPINPVKSRDMRLYYSRSEWTGFSKCTANVSAYWEQALPPF